MSEHDELQTPATELEIVALLGWITREHGGEDTRMIVRKLAFERDQLKAELARLRTLEAAEKAREQ